MSNTKKMVALNASAPSETVPEFVARKSQQFDELAPRFELRCWFYSIGFLNSVRRRTAQMALSPSAHQGTRVLDMCCGTGGITRELQRLFPVVVGVDLSPKMLDVAKRRCPGAEFVCGEAGSTPLSTEPFDACVLGLCLHEMPAALRDALLTQAAGQLEQGGRIVVSDYAWPAKPWMRAIVRSVAPTLIEPDIVEFLDWPLDQMMAKLGFRLVEDARLYRGILRLSAWSRISQ